MPIMSLNSFSTGLHCNLDIKKVIKGPLCDLDIKKLIQQVILFFDTICREGQINMNMLHVRYFGQAFLHNCTIMCGMYLYGTGQP
jgi:hypothetical protein